VVWRTKNHVVWRTERSRETRKSQEVQGPRRKQEIADEYLCMTAAVPVKRGFGTGFVPLGFLCTARLSELADSQEKARRRGI
jgi:hypothetical protein